MIHRLLLFSLVGLIPAVPLVLAESLPPVTPKKTDEVPDRKPVPVAGTVQEVLTSGGYTYVNLATAGGPVWAAFPTVPVTVGTELTLVPGYEMRNFTSKSLNRTFERLVFTAGPAEKQAIDPNLVKEAHKARDAQVPPAAGQPAQPLPAASLVPPHAAPPKNIGNVKVSRAAGANAYTVKELYARRSALDNKRVVVRGKVVKINPRILRQCWIHLQDGSGRPGKSDSVLVTTTPSTNRNLPRIGDVVTATGTLHKDRDYGGGYRYAVILENTEYRTDRTEKR